MALPKLATDGTLRTVLLVVAVLLLVPAVGGLLAYVVTPGSATTLAPAALAPYLMAASVPALLAFVFTRQWWGALVAALLAVVLVALTAPLYIPSAAPPDSQSLVVMTSNLRLGQADATDVVDQVRTHRVEVLMLQELTPALQTRLIAAGLDDALPYKISDPSFAAVGTGLWSRYPLTPVTMASLSLNSVAARVQIPGLDSAPILVALHVAGPVPDATLWSRDMDRLPGVLDALPDNAPVLVGGDFNATPSVNRFRHLLEKGYDDAGNQAGGGLLRTYPSDRAFPPLLGIDHVLARGGPVGTSAETLQIKGSDHRALLVTVAVPRTS